MADAQVHIVVGEIPRKSSQRMSRTLGGGALALRSDEDIVFLQNRLQQKLEVLKTMYDNGGWGVRSSSVSNAASRLEKILEPASVRNEEVSARNSSVASTRPLWSRGSHQRAMESISGGAMTNRSQASLPRQLYPLGPSRSNRASSTLVEVT